MVIKDKRQKKAVRFRMDVKKDAETQTDDG